MKNFWYYPTTNKNSDSNNNNNNNNNNKNKISNDANGENCLVDHILYHHNLHEVW